jgi:hypothetical protein
VTSYPLIQMCVESEVAIAVRQASMNSFIINQFLLA